MPLDDSRKCKKGYQYQFVLVTMHRRESATLDLFKLWLKRYCPIGIKCLVSEEEYTTSEGTHFHAVLTSKARFKVNRMFTAANKSETWKGMNFHAWRDLRSKGNHEAQVEYCEKYLKNPSKDKVLGQVGDVIIGDPPHYAETMEYIQGVIAEHRRMMQECNVDSRGAPSSLHREW